MVDLRFDAPRKDFHSSKTTSIPTKMDQCLDVHCRVQTTHVRHVLKISDLDKETIQKLIVKALHIKHYPELYTHRLHNHCLLMLFEKPSLRTRLSFETGMAQLGGHAIFYSIYDSPLGKKEDIRDTAKCVSRLADIAMARSKDRHEVWDLAKNSDIPVINALDDYAHPAQVLSDLFSIAEYKLLVTLDHRGSDIEFKGLKLAYFGDCRNNVTYDLMRAGALMGFDVVVCGPKNFPVEDCVWDEVRELSKKTGAKVTYTEKIDEAIKDADVVYTDSWMSYHIPQSEEPYRIQKFSPYQVTTELLKKAKKDVIFMNCLPAQRGREQTAEVIDGPYSIVYDQAENRLHAQKALLLYLKQGEAVLDEEPVEEEILSEMQSLSALSRGRRRKQGAKHCLVALGGNALATAHQEHTFSNLKKGAERTACSLLPLIRKGYKLTISHGNGPQVGALKIQNQRAKNETPEMPLHMCDAMTQGEIGVIIQQALMNKLTHEGMHKKKVVTLTTQVEVNENDPAFSNPSKPIGDFYSEEEAKKMTDRTMKKDSGGKGYREVVPSPEPKNIIEIDAIRSLSDEGFIVISGGGGGVPVIKDRRTNDLVGVDAVIDKDKTSALLAKLLDADMLLILTDVDHVYLNMNDEKKKKPLFRLDIADARRYMEEGHFGEGSMKPKIEAACNFVSHTGRTAIITSLDKLEDALEGKCGTLICH